MSTAKGAPIYVSAAELEGLGEARALLSMLLETADVISPEMAAATAALDSVSDKARKARRASGRRQVVAQALKVATAQEPSVFYDRYQMDRPLFTAQVGSDELRIEVGNRADLPFTLECNRRHNGNPAFMELPRRYQTMRGAKLAAAQLMGEPLQWKAAAED